MSTYNYNQFIAQFRSFRQQLRDCFNSYSDSIIDLLDAMAGNSVGASSFPNKAISSSASHPAPSSERQRSTYLPFPQ
ncbi:hypothetical protein SD80_015175 [Scytonema tolypothrichoides VB-61278]|nr:hypothetical protein SD80_015175 [Scytonema tolypothrichoides VB-61278]